MIFGGVITIIIMNCPTDIRGETILQKLDSGLDYGKILGKHLYSKTTEHAQKVSVITLISHRILTTRKTTQQNFNVTFCPTEINEKMFSPYCFYTYMLEH